MPAPGHASTGPTGLDAVTFTAGRSAVHLVTRARSDGTSLCAVTFAGFPEAALDFYDDLEMDNTKSFWAAHKHVYETAVAAPMEALLSALEPQFGRAKVFRPYRDVRFAKDKTPYKNHQGGFCANGESSGWYIQVDARGVHVSAGTYATSAQSRAALRGAVDSPRGAHLQRLLDDLVSAGWSVEGDKVKTRPRGCPPDHPRLALMRHNSLWVTFDYGFAPVVHSPELLDRVRGHWESTRPLVDWLGDATRV